MDKGLFMLTKGTFFSFPELFGQAYVFLDIEALAYQK